MDQKRLLDDKQRELWVLQGYLEMGFSRDTLEPIARKYKLMDLVPQHYNFAELWGTTEKPAFELKLDDMFAR